jgi:hypothetical protein
MRNKRGDVIANRVESCWHENEREEMGKGKGK